MQKAYEELLAMNNRPIPSKIAKQAAAFLGRQTPLFARLETGPLALSLRENRQPPVSAGTLGEDAYFAQILGHTLIPGETPSYSVGQSYKEFYVET
jgi:hypothetical protein